MFQGEALAIPQICKAVKIVLDRHFIPNQFVSSRKEHYSESIIIKSRLKIILEIALFSFFDFCKEA